MKTSVICANGLGWSPDNRVFYFTESFRYGIYAYNFNPATENISNRRLFASIDRNSDGFPDGLTVDEEGYVWSVHNAVGRVVRYSPSGAIDRVIEIPVPRPTSCIFGGDELDVLYITSARETMTSEEIAQAPLSGSLFAVKPGVKGLPEPYFTG
jgi:sugar lactone lactonase YvrE